MSYILPEASEKQLQIIACVERGNVVVNSVAGSGKTTTNLHIAKANVNKKILLLTYNRKLKEETREKVKLLNITNMEVHSYHSFCVLYYNKMCYRDNEIIKVNEYDTRPIRYFKYDIVILDEAQDICPLYYKLVCKIIRDMCSINNYETVEYSADELSDLLDEAMSGVINEPADLSEPVAITKYEDCPNFVIMGDEQQSIYAFNYADERFIKYAHRLFDFNHKKWDKVDLDISYRITLPMANFINYCIFGYEKIKAIKNGAPVKYMICNTFNAKTICDTVITYLNAGYSYADIFIIAPSIKSERSPVRELENMLSNRNIPVYIPASDDAKVDEDIAKGKITFSTMHQVKGLERKVVIVYGIDETYYEYFAKDLDSTKCSNTIYVSITRAMEHLIILQHCNNSPVSYLNMEALDKYCKIINIDAVKIIKNVRTKMQIISVCDLIKHLPAMVLAECIKYITVKEIIPKSEKIHIPIKVASESMQESVSEITGVAIPAFLEWKRTKKISIYNEHIWQEVMSRLSSKKQQIILRGIEINLNSFNIRQLLLLSNIWLAYSTGYISRLSQIKKYDWLEKEQLLQSTELLSSKISITAKYEQLYKVAHRPELLGRALTGYIDCIDDTILWEFKCVDELTQEHILQLAVYAYMYEVNKGTSLKYYLYNLLNGQCLEILFNKLEINNMISYLFAKKFNSQTILSDEEFINKIISSC